MAGKFFDQIVSQSYFTESTEYSDSLLAESTGLEQKVPNNIQPGQLPPIKWSSGLTFEQSVVEPTIDNVIPIGGMPPISSLADGRYFISCELPTITQSILRYGKHTTVGSGVMTIEYCFCLSGDTTSAYYHPSMTYQNKTGTPLVVVYTSEDMDPIPDTMSPTTGYFKGYTILMDKRNGVTNWWYYDEQASWPHAMELTAPVDDTYEFLNMMPMRMGYVPFSRILKTPEDIRKEPSPTRRVVKANTSITITQDTLWKEVQYTNDIQLQFKLEQEKAKAGGLGYVWNYVKFKTADHTYSYQRGSEKIEAHTTLSLNNLQAHSFNGGPLPTDFSLRHMDVIGIDSYIYVDYWDNSEMFANLSYARNLSAQFTGQVMHGGSLPQQLGIPVGHYPQVVNVSGPNSSGKYTAIDGTLQLQFLAVVLSQQSTDFISVNSLRFIFKVIDATKWVLANRPLSYGGSRAIMSGQGIVSCRENYGSGVDERDYVLNTFTGVASFISLVPANAEYQSPMLQSTTVRKDLEAKIDELRQEFNNLSASVALNDLIGIAMIPFSIASLVGSLGPLASSIKNFASRLMTKFKSSATFRFRMNMPNIDLRLRRWKIPKRTPRGSAGTGSIVDSLDTISTLSDDILQPDVLRNLSRNSSVRSTRSTGSSIMDGEALTFDDLAVAVASNGIRELDMPADMVQDIVIEAADNFIPRRSYRILADDEVYEIGPDMGIIAYNSRLENIQVDMNRFFDLMSDSPVLQAVIDFTTIKAMRDNYGITFDAARRLINSDASFIRSFINSQNPIISKRIEDLLLQCRI
ncbi:VP4 [Rotavirus K]|nr:VP4 [Rotavirus K]